jgi:hypothetical protein
MAKGSMFRYLPLFMLAALNPFKVSKVKVNTAPSIGPIYAGSGIYIPRRGKLKGWQKELKRNKYYNKFG